MATKAEWLTANGHNAGRGRPSKAKQAAIAAYLAGGGVWDDESTKPAKTSGDAPKASKPKPAPKATDIIEPAQPLWEGITYRDEYSKDVSPNEVCGNCRASLPWCRCRMFSWALNSLHTQGIVKRYKGKVEVFFPGS